MTLRLIFSIIISFTLTYHPGQANAASKKSDPKVLKINYEGFTVWLDCSKHGAVKFQYKAHHDNGSAARGSSFYLDPNIPAKCQQTSAEPYGPSYDRGHLVPANHLDDSEVSITQTT